MDEQLGCAMSNSRYYYLECATNPYCCFVASLLFTIELLFDFANVVQNGERAKIRIDFLSKKWNLVEKIGGISENLPSFYPCRSWQVRR